MRTPKPRLLLADDHAIVLEGLQRLLASDFELVGTATNGIEMVERCRGLAPDLVVADVSMPLMSGVDAVRALRREGNQTRVVFLSMHPDVTAATRALAAGGAAYVLKHSASDELVAAIRAVLAGQTFVSPALRTPALDERLATAHAGRLELELTPRQRDVLRLLAQGKSAKEIGAILGISPRTAETHKYKMMDDLGLPTTAELIQYAFRHGLVDAEPPP